MIRRFSPDLSKMDIYANGIELVHTLGRDRSKEGERIYTRPESEEAFITSIANPVLMSDLAALNKLSPPIRDTVNQLYGSRTHITEFDNTSMRFVQDNFPGLWGPNIDTLVLCHAVQGQNLRGHGLEVGAGSGYISKYALDHNKDIETLELLDLNPAAINCWRENIADTRARFTINDAITYLKAGKEYDFMLCNPPYIPRKKTIEDNAFEGVGLFSYLIENMDKLLPTNGPFYANYSNLCEDEVHAVAEKHGRIIESLVTKRVPLKVYSMYNTPEWLTYLEKECGLIRETDRGDHWYWQDITVSKITQK